MENTLVLNESELKCDVKKFIVNNFLFGMGDNLFASDDSLLEKGIVDSTGVLELIAYLEQNYKMKINNDELIPENLDSLDNIASFVFRKKI
jgi:acyl carrier protein